MSTVRRAASVGCAVRTSSSDTRREISSSRHICEPGERIAERLAQQSLLVCVRAMPADAMLLLGDVRELEVRREGAQDARLPLERQLADRRSQVVGRNSFACSPREPAHPLDVVQQRLVLLLDEDAPEDVAEQANVPPQRRVSRLLHR